MRSLLALLALALALAVPTPSFGQGSPIGPSNFSICNQTAQVTGTAGTTTQIVALASAPAGPGGVLPRIYVCGFLFTNTAAAGTFQLFYGTGANCVTSPVALTPILSVGSSAVAVYSTNPSIATPPAQALCINTSVTTITGLVWFSQF